MESKNGIFILSPMNFAKIYHAFQPKLSFPLSVFFVLSSQRSLNDGKGG